MKQELTPREIEILSKFANGTRTSEICEDLHIERGTLKNHVHHILNKLGARNIANAVYFYCAPPADGKVVSRVEYEALKQVESAGRSDPDPTARMRHALIALDNLKKEN